MGQVQHLKLGQGSILESTVEMLRNMTGLATLDLTKMNVTRADF